MKAILKSTGEIIDVKPRVYVLTDKDYLSVSSNEIEILEPDWEQVRVKASIAAMQGFLANGMRDGSIESITKLSVEFADGLVKELQKGKEVKNEMDL